MRKGQKVGPKVDLTGKKFGRLTVLALHPERIHYGKQTILCWLCHCDCGAEVIVRGGALSSGNTASCGCARMETIRRNAKHGLSKSRAYRVWAGMKNGCFNPNSTGYSNWGGRGIGIDERWHEFKDFYADVGNPPKGLSFDRPDNNGNYSPTNWRWADRSTQSHNRRTRRAGLRGVYLDKRTGRWWAAIGFNNASRHLGTFDTPEEAARAYDAAAIKYFSPLAMTNYPVSRSGGEIT